MSDKSLFRRNLVIIVTLHILLVGIFLLTGLFPKHPDMTEVDGGGSSSPQASQSNDTENTPEETPPESSPQKSPEDSGTSEPSLIVLGTPAPSPSATPRRTPTPPKPSPTPTPRTPTPTATPPPPTAVPTTPKRSPHPTATAKKSPSRSPSPKTSAKKSASPKTSPKHSASPSGSAKPGEEAANNTEAGTESTSGTTTGPKGKPGTRPGEGGGNRGGSGHQGGAERAAQINWYLNMIHDRFYSKWDRPVSILKEGEQLTAIVKIRVQRNGHISDASLEKSSGNSVMDGSVMAAAKSIDQIDPLPASIEDSFYDVPIEFDLTPD